MGLLKSKEEPLIKAAVLRNPAFGNAINRWRGFESKEIIDLYKKDRDLFFQMFYNPCLRHEFLTEIFQE